MKRREFLALLGGASAAPIILSRPARAQQPAKPVIGFIHIGVADRFSQFVAAFRQGLKESGFVEGQNLTIEYRWAEGQIDRLPVLADDLVRRKVAAIFATGGPPGVLAAKKATSTIPIVFVASDPLRFGIVKSMSRPEGNLTGVGLFSASMGAKRVDILIELVPSATTIAALINPDYPTTEGELADLQAAARARGKRLVVLRERRDSDLDAAFATLAQEKAGALVVATDTLLMNSRARLIALAAKQKVPTIYFQREFVADGGLMSYSNCLTDSYRQAGVYMARILKGAKPSDLPVVQPTKFELVINLKTAKALGLTVPQTLQVAADEVIE